MANLTIIYWRDIPAQVLVAAGRARAKRQLPERFQQAIDAAATRTSTISTDDYLAEWRRSAPQPCGDDIEAEAERAQASLEREFGADRLAALVRGGGREDDGGT